MTRRGRPRKHRWFRREDLERDFSSEAQYLKWASANHTGLQTVAATGCPNCRGSNPEFRHDGKLKIIRFHCIDCQHETSYRLKMPKPGSFNLIPIYDGGVSSGYKIVDTYHPATARQRSDAIVLKAARGVDSGRISLGGEWYVKGTAGGLHDQKRYCISFEEATSVCSWNRMQADHEKRLREVERDAAI